MLAVDGELVESLGHSDASIRALLREGSSQNTVASYRSAINYWVAWHALRIASPFTLPVPVRTVLQFVADHLEHASDDAYLHDLPPEIDAALVAQRIKRRPGPLSLATVRHRLAVLSEAHEAKALPNPCRSRAVQAVMERARSAYAKRGVRAGKKDALTREPLEQLLATCDESLIGLRDRALLLFAWSSGGRRRSEVVRATIENMRRVPEGFLYTLTHSKSNQAGEERADAHKPVVGRAAAALQAWLDAAGIVSGPLFVRVRRGGVIGGALAPEAVRRMVKARAVQAGLEGDFAAHSLRSGFITEAARQQVPIGDIMAMTGHAAVSSVMGYHRAASAIASKAARLIDQTPRSPTSGGDGEA